MSVKSMLLSDVLGIKARIGQAEKDGIVFELTLDTDRMLRVADSSMQSAQRIVRCTDVFDGTTVILYIPFSSGEPVRIDIIDHTTS